MFFCLVFCKGLLINILNITEALKKSLEIFKKHEIRFCITFFILLYSAEIFDGNPVSKLPFQVNKKAQHSAVFF